MPFTNDEFEKVIKPKSHRLRVTSDATTSDGNSNCMHDTAACKNCDQLLRVITDNIIGRNEPLTSPFGVKAQCYANYTTSGKALKNIENFMRDMVMPTYGNTHTTTSVTGIQTTAFREDARQIIAKAVNASEAKDLVLFTGHGCTSAIQKLILILGINSFKRTRRTCKRPVIFTGPFAHHTNLSRWRENLAADIVEIPEASNGGLDMKELEHQLKAHSNRKLRIGTFAAAANFSGMLLDVDQISRILHQHGALACWDYDTCAPYVKIDMNPSDPLAFKDAILVSGHNFIGGQGSSGVLIVKKNLLNNEVPTMPGGGTVLFVTEKHQQYATTTEREEGGTPDILGNIRLGMAFALKQSVGTEKIVASERRHIHYVREFVSRNPHIVLLGHDDENMKYLPIFSMMFRCDDRFLHHNFVCALLNDLFGIQAHSGCQYADPYAARLLGIDKEQWIALENAMEENQIIKPGVVRISFPYFSNDAEIDYILDAVCFVADHGWKLLPQYIFDIHSSAWRHISCAKKNHPMKSLLSELKSFSEDKSSFGQPVIRCIASHRRENLEQAARQAEACIKKAALLESLRNNQILPLRYEWLRWFVYPHEVVESYKNNGEKMALTDKIIGLCQPRLHTKVVVAPIGMVRWPLRR
ncbi:hypothetical protein CCR75_003158 [Bremia lactucae]|uniref:Aminotransferase class V domain-containing protein n=1 Tax=Bremia lactucae TaxID=4779 RepID=A0A976IID6_BRELC|nr:hypothetical protein CCR75_003158 [Bremia lactucae]